MILLAFSGLNALDNLGVGWFFDRNTTEIRKLSQLHEKAKQFGRTE